jgi:hypothetical protein
MGASKRTGVYGEGALVEAVHKAGWADFYWQSASTSYPGNATTLPITQVQQGLGGPIPGTDADRIVLPLIPAPTPQPPAPPQEATGMATEDPISGGSWGIKPDGAVFSFDGAPYLGGLNNHPEWHTPAVGPVAGLCAWKGDGTDANGNGYVIYVSAPAGFALYRFPRNGKYAK